MIYLVHGDDTVKSRALILNQQTKLGVEKRTEIEISDTTPAVIFEKVSSEDLFGSKPFVVLDISGASKEKLEPFAEMLCKVPENSVLIIYSSKELTKTNPVLNAVSKCKGTSRLNKKEIEGNIFTFVDYLFSKNRAQTYKEYEKLIKTDTDPLYIFSMIAYGLRNISILLFESPSATKMSPFVKMKTVKQVKYYSEISVKSIYTYLYELEKKAKTGLVEPDVLVTLSIEKVLNS